MASSGTNDHLKIIVTEPSCAIIYLIKKKLLCIDGHPKTELHNKISIKFNYQFLTTNFLCGIVSYGKLTEVHDTSIFKFFSNILTGLMVAAQRDH